MAHLTLLSVEGLTTLNRKLADFVQWGLVLRVLLTQSGLVRRIQRTTSPSTLEYQNNTYAQFMEIQKE